MSYKEGTPLAEIIDDGWSRGFQLEQTVKEATAMGFEVTEAFVKARWESLEENIACDTLGCCRASTNDAATKSKNG